MTIGADKRIDFPVVGSFAEDPVGKIDAQRTINMYEVLDPDGKKPKHLAPWPGLDQFREFSAGGIARASIVFKGDVYFAVGNSIYRMDSGFIISILSGPTLATSVGHVGVAANETQVAFVDNATLLIWDTGTATLTDETAQLTAVNVDPLDITYMDSYFIVVNGSSTITNQFYISDQNNGKSWTSGNFALIESRPTILSACAVLKRRVFFFGETKSEVWLDAGLADFPFRRDNNLLLEHGIKAQASLTEGFDRLFYLSNDEDGVGSIMMIMGTMPRPISTREIDETIQNFTTPEDATGFVFKINGQIFYQINFSIDQRTFVYNVDTNKWHELEMLDETRHIGNTHAFYKGRHFMGSYNDSFLYELGNDFLTNAGERIKRTRIAHVMSSPTYERIRLNRFHVDMLQGVGIPDTLGIDADPVIFLSISEDGGVTYHNFDRREVGKSGARVKRTIWRRLGTRRDAIIKLEMFNNVVYYILGAAADIEVLPE